MRYFLLTGIRHGESEPVLIGFPGGKTAPGEFKALVGTGAHDEFREVHLLSSSSGIIRQRKLKPVAPAEVPPVETAPAEDAEPKAKRKK